MFFVEEEGTSPSFQVMRKVITAHGLLSSLYTDRGSHYWRTPKVGGKVDKHNLTQFGRAIKQLGIKMISTYSSEARGRCERMFSTHQNRLPRELATQGITTLEAANRYRRHYVKAEGGSTAIPMSIWRFFTAPEGWPAIPRRDSAL